MRHLRYGVAMSLDGFIACTDGSSEWIVEDKSIDFDKIFASFDAFIMGRKTYETMLALGDGNQLASQPKEAVVVVSRQMKKEDHPEITVISKDYLDYIQTMKLSNGKDIWLMGGGEIAGQCLEAGLVDHLDVAVIPVILGTGIKLFAMEAMNDTNKSWKLEIESVENLAQSGILMTKYKVSKQS
ncbi:hypothetical protein NLG97_g4979 [Lecanicillium saksenae]|uniref:Uncharacterized protein n=1 Tax=Lecanicillium saksenae TaxID=468837 RepID=A0ACC1QVM0_9HYPO|nr:hypothetical protein NLG97_g4979 [Lecanicillium saksenae]